MRVLVVADDPGLIAGADWRGSFAQGIEWLGPIANFDQLADTGDHAVDVVLFHVADGGNRIREWSEVARRGSALPGIAFGPPSREIMRDGMKAGVREYLVEPLDPIETVEAIRRVLRFEGRHPRFRGPEDGGPGRDEPSGRPSPRFPPGAPPTLTSEVEPPAD